MEPIASVLDTIKGFVQSGEQFVKGAFQRCFDPHRKNPIEILKRLQRETFSDLMKIRDRQDKVERIISSFMSGKGSPFHEASTQLKGIINVDGALLFQDDQQAYHALDSSRINTGIDARFTFKINLRQKDALFAEFASHQNTYHGNGVTGSPLVLSKVMYLASISDSLSVISIPYGATCNDFLYDSDHTQGECLTVRPPLFNLYHACAVGLSVKTSNFAAAFAELFSGWRTEMGPASHSNKLSTFGQISFQNFGETRLTLSGVWHMPRSFSLPIRLCRCGSCSKPDEMELAFPVTGRRSTGSSGGSIYMSIDIDESSKFGVWFEVQKLNPTITKWALSLSDMPESEIGWGITVEGSSKGQSNSVLLESYLNFSVGKKASLQPGLAFIIDERSRAPALVFRSTWSF
ncbi:unnamed protein product [Musa banksii]